MKKYSAREFPPYKFTPGHGQHPEKNGGYLHGKEIESEELTLKNYKTHEIYLHAIDLFNHGYFWDAHVYWEVLWNLAGRKGNTANFLKGLIKLAAAGVKFQLNHIQPARDHLSRAEELFLQLDQPYLGIQTIQYTKKIQENFQEFNLDFLFSKPLKIEEL